MDIEQKFNMSAEELYSIARNYVKETYGEHFFFTVHGDKYYIIDSRGSMGTTDRIVNVERFFQNAINFINK